MKFNSNANIPKNPINKPVNPKLLFIELNSISLFLEDNPPKLGILKLPPLFEPVNNETNPNLNQYFAFIGKSNDFVFSIAGFIKSNAFHSVLFCYFFNI